jgi:hypothetical protein
VKVLNGVEILPERLVQPPGSMIARVAQAVEADEAFDPVDVGFFGAEA